jgi:M6 family metalloprotease-like protein
MLPLSAVRTEAVVSTSTYETLFQDDFSQGLTKWHSVQGEWAIQNGELHGTSGKGEGVVSAGEMWTDYVFSARAKSLSNVSDDLLVRFQDSGNYYRIVLLWDHMEIWLRRQGNDQLLYREASWGYSLNTTDWHRIGVKIYGEIPTITAYLDDYPEITVKDMSGQHIASGMIGLGVNENAASAFASVKVTTLHPDSTGAQRAILLLVEFPDMKHTMTSDQVYQNVFPKLNQYYTEVSYNQTWIVGTITPSWKMLQRPTNYYDVARVTGLGFQNGRHIQFLKDAILVWDSEVDYRQYDYVFVAGPANSVWGYTDFQVDIAKTDDGVFITAATAQTETQGWDVYAHEFAHLSLGLPDLYSYEIAFTGPADFRQAAVYVGPWDLMSRANIRPQIGAWGKIHVGWIPGNRTMELFSSQQAAVTVNPLEKPTSGIQAIVVYLTPTTSFIVENREQMGFDSVLPDKGILISYVDEGKYWRTNGPVVVQDAHPDSGPRWQLLHPTYDIGPQAKSLYTNQTFNLAVEVLDRFPNGSYVVAVGKPDSMDIAKAAYLKLNEANSAVQEASETGRTQGLGQAKAALGEAWRHFSGGDFKLAQDLAEQAIVTANAVTVLSKTQTTSSQTLVSVMVPIMTGAIIVGIAVLILRRRRRFTP